MGVRLFVSSAVSSHESVIHDEIKTKIWRKIDSSSTRGTSSVIIILLNWLFFVFDHFVVIFVVASALSLHILYAIRIVIVKKADAKDVWNLNWIVFIHSEYDRYTHEFLYNGFERRQFFSSFFLFVSEVEFKKEKREPVRVQILEQNQSEWMCIIDS